MEAVATPPSPYRIGSPLSILFITFRITFANLSPLMDCDEVYNYWEPLHFLLYGYGMQTWEYAPTYALRTYAYLYPMVGIGKFWQYLLKCFPSNHWKQTLSSLLLLSSSSSMEKDPINITAEDDVKPLIFALLRSTLATIACLSELYFLDALFSTPLLQLSTPTTTLPDGNHHHDDDHPLDSKKQANSSGEYGHSCSQQPSSLSVRIPQDEVTVHYAAFIGLFASGNFHAMGSYLPSATITSLWKMSVANMLWNNDDIAIIWAVLAVLSTGWPFCAALFLPVGVRALWNASGRRRTSDAAIARKTAVEGDRMAWKTMAKSINIEAVVQLVLRSCLYTIFIALGVALIDYHSYGFWVFPTWNIFAYNSQGGGDELYGVEPLSYYVKNLALNFNVLPLLGLVSLPLTWLRKWFDRGCLRSSSSIEMETFLLLPMYIWIALIFPRPHKEERFLYPIYPLLSYAAAITLREILSMLRSVSPSFGKWCRGGRVRREFFLGGILLFFPAAISISRSMALHCYYSAPIEVHRELYYHASSVTTADTSSLSNEKILVCTAGEWYRYPSSFFLPANHRLGYLKSSFGGQLPQAFTAHGSRVESLTVPGVGHFNDRNEEEIDRYVDISMCSYVIELVPGHMSTSGKVPEGARYMKSDDSGGYWDLLASRRFLDVENTSLLRRILYLPSFTSGAGNDALYKSYELYKKKI